jgi:pyruvate formate lyase activating enzyme
VKKAILYKKASGNLVCCNACSWYCKIAPNQTGVCGVRANIDGELMLLVYGKTTGMAVDPIEKKPLYHFLPSSTAFSIGTFGCDFGCLFCQNWYESQTPKHIKESAKKDSLAAIIRLIETSSRPVSPSEIVTTAIENACSSIAYTYNEPAVFVEYAFEAMKIAKKEGLRNVFVSNGYESKESFRLTRDYLDAINIDIKAATEEFYLKYCKARLTPVLENIKRFHDAGIWVELTTLLIHNTNDSEKDLRWIAEFIKDIDPSIPWHLSAMHPDYKMIDSSFTPYSTLERAWNIGREVGLKYVYAYTTEQTTEKDSTFCPKCNELLIERHFMMTQIHNFKTGKCGRCGAKIEGIWS